MNQKTNKYIIVIKIIYFMNIFNNLYKNFKYTNLKMVYLKYTLQNLNQIILLIVFINNKIKTYILINIIFLSINKKSLNIKLFLM